MEILQFKMNFDQCHVKMISTLFDLKIMVTNLERKNKQVSLVLNHFDLKFILNCNQKMAHK